MPPSAGAVGQHIGVADVASLREIRGERRFHHRVLHTFAAGERDLDAGDL